MAEKRQIKVVNSYTGEIISVEYDPTDPVKMHEVLDEVDAQIKELEKIKEGVRGDVAHLLASNDYKPLDAGNGYEFKWIAPVGRIYSVEAVQRFIDPDQLITEGVVAVKNGALEKLVKKLVKENGIAPEAWQAIQESAELKATAPYPKLERVR